MRECILDTEANGLLDTITQFHCAVFKDIKTEEVFKFRPEDMKSSFVSFLKSCSKIIGHNIIDYDLPAIKKILGFEYQGEIEDTLILSRLQQPNISRPVGYTGRALHSVEAWGWRVGRGKVEHNDWSVFSEEMLHRCSEDVEIQFLVWKILKDQQEKEGWASAARLTTRLFYILQKQEEAGWKFDCDYAKFCIGWLTRKIQRIDNAVLPHLPVIVDREETVKGGLVSFVAKPFKKDGTYSLNVVKWMDSVGISVDDGIVGGPFSRVSFRRVDLNSNDETKKFLISQGWKPKEWNTNDDGERTSPKLDKDDPFEGINGKLGKLIAKRVQCRHRLSTLEGLLEKVREDGRIPARVAGIANTGRMKHAVVVNIPGEEAFFGIQMRKCFTSEDGKVLVGIDSAGCQNRMLAARVKDDNFTNILLHGKKEDKTSIHYVNQAAIKLVADEEVSYHSSKTLNYAFMFGASDKKLGSIINKGKDVGASIRKAFLSVSPGFEKLVDDITQEWRRTAQKTMRYGKVSYYNGYIRGLDGRPVMVASEHALLVYLLQSDEAIMMSAAYCWLYKRLLKAGLKWGEDFTIVCFYHDEFTVECKEELAPLVKKIGEECIADAGKFYKIACEHEGDGKIGKNWSEIH